MTFNFQKFQTPKKEGDGADVPMDDKKKNRSLEDCIIQNVHECKNPVWQIVPYLCGQDPMCRERTEVMGIYFLAF